MCYGYDPVASILQVVGIAAKFCDLRICAQTLDCNCDERKQIQAKRVCLHILCTNIYILFGHGIELGGFFGKEYILDDCQETGRFYLKLHCNAMSVLLIFMSTSLAALVLYILNQRKMGDVRVDIDVDEFLNRIIR